MSDSVLSPDTATRLVSHGHLPAGPDIDTLLERTHEGLRGAEDGEVSDVYPALQRADPDRFGIAMVGVDGDVHEAGDSRLRFTLMSVVKPFTFALVVGALGIERVRDLVGMNATGLPFDSLAAVDRSPGGRTNPMVNAGAIATTSLAPGGTLEDRWEWLRAGLSACAGRELALDDEVYTSASETNLRNRAIAALLRSVDGLAGDPADAVELYTRSCSLAVTAVDLAVMGATLADGGENPFTGEQVVAPDVARASLVAMAVAGMYEDSGDWLLDVGIPGKSGIAGGIVTVSPGKGALGTYSAPLDAAGNSVRGALAAAYLARALGLDLLASEPVRGSL